jgi:hypothetical protein
LEMYSDHTEVWGLLSLFTPILYRRILKH